MNFAALLQGTSASSILTASGLAAEFKTIVPSDLFIALGLGFVVGAVIAFVYKKTYRGVLYSPTFAITLIMLTLITTARLNDIDPKAWLADVLARIADLSVSHLPELLPWEWKRLRDAEKPAD